MDIRCFVKGCYQPPFLACECRENLNICCVYHYSIHVSEDLDAQHSTMKLEKQIKDADKEKYLDQLRSILSNEISTRSRILRMVQEINSESDRIISQSLKVCSTINKMIKDIQAKGFVLALSKANIKNQSFMNDQIFNSIIESFGEYKKSDWKYFKVSESNIQSVVVDGMKENISQNQRRTIQIFANLFTGQTITIDTQESELIKDIKSKIEMKNGVPSCEQRLVFRGKELKDDRSISEYKIERGSTLYVLLRLSSGMLIFIKYGERKIKLYVSNSRSVKTIKEEIEANEGLESGNITLKFQSIELADNHQISFYNLKQGSELTLTYSLPN